MHDIDRIMQEAEYEGQFEMETAEDGWDDAEGSPFDEAREMALASEMLTIADDQQLDQFLGRLVKGASRFIRSGTGRALTGALRGVARQALPQLGRMAGAVVGGPAGAAVGGRIASFAGQKLGLELEGLAPEEQEFEVARRVVRLAGEAAVNAAQASAGTSPAVAAREALVSAARRHAPGLLQERGNNGRSSSGRWVRQGNQIILYGV